MINVDAYNLFYSILANLGLFACMIFGVSTVFSLGVLFFLKFLK